MDMLKNAHSEAYNQIKEMIQLEDLLNLVLLYLTGELDQKQVEEKLRIMFGSLANEYIRLFEESLFNQTIDLAFESIEELNDEQIKKLFADKVDDIIDIVAGMAGNKINKEEALQQFIPIAKELAESTLRVYGFDMDDVRVIKAAMAGQWQLVAFAVLNECYQYMMQIFDEGHLIHEERKECEAYCKQMVEEIRKYREEIERNVSDYMEQHIEVMQLGLKAMDEAILNHDSNGYIKGNVEIQKLLGYDVQFENDEEFDALMESDEDFVF